MARERDTDAASFADLDRVEPLRPEDTVLLPDDTPHEVYSAIYDRRPCSVEASRCSTPNWERSTRSRRLWRCRVDIEGVPITLSIMGTRRAPDPAALGLACTIAERFDTWRPAIEAELRDHATAAGATPDRIPLPCYAAVIPVDGQPTVELGYQVPWDDDHTLGAHLRDDRLVELNGSVLEP